jgi:plastocyanin
VNVEARAPQPGEEEDLVVNGLMRRWLAVGAAVAAVGGLTAAGALAKTISVCPHGCRYSAIQSAVNATGRNATILVAPGTYREEVLVTGHRHDGLTIKGTGATPDAVVLQGKNAHIQGSPAQDGVEGDGVNHLTLENMKAVNYQSNGFFLSNAHGYLMKKLVAGFEKSYGLYVYRSVGGRMTESVGYGNGDSAFYVGGTPFQRHPSWTTLDHDTGYENVLGYSGTNSKYIVIRDSRFYNNGAGVVPNTLITEPDQPADTGVIEDNQIFWNNFDYYRAGSPVHTVSGGLSGSAGANYPIGAGVILFGTTNWIVKDNAIFGNFLWGVGSFSNPLQQAVKSGQTTIPNKAINNDNHVTGNTLGAGGRDPNGRDFFNDGSGTGTCFSHNAGTLTYEMAGSGKFSTYPTYLPAPFNSFTGQITPDHTVAYLYPTCPQLNGTKSAIGDIPQDLGVLAAVSLIPQPINQDTFWTVHSHPGFDGLKPYTGPPARPPQTSAAAVAAKAAPVKTVMVLDDYFKPDKLTVKLGTVIKWVWSDHNYDTHNVTLKSGPKGVRRSKFSSIDGTSGLVFKRTLTVPGTYHFYCTIHPAMMTMTIVVKR